MGARDCARYLWQMAAAQGATGGRGRKREGLRPRPAAWEMRCGRDEGRKEEEKKIKKNYDMWVPYVIVKSHFHMSPNQTYDRDDPSPLDQTQDAVILSLKTRSEPSRPTVSPNQMLPKISRRVLLEKYQIIVRVQYHFNQTDSSITTARSGIITSMG